MAAVGKRQSEKFSKFFEIFDIFLGFENHSRIRELGKMHFRAETGHAVCGFCAKRVLKSVEVVISHQNLKNC